MLPDTAMRCGVCEACMNCCAGFYATIINIAAYPSLPGLLGVAGQRARAQ